MIPLFKPQYDYNEIEAITLTLKSAWTGLGSQVALFEKQFAQYVGTKYAVAVNSGTSALNLAIKCLVEPGSHIITSPISFVSTVSAIIENGCKPIFVDVNPHTMNLDPDRITTECLRNASAIIPVHYAGRPCDMAGITLLAKNYDLTVIEDAAHACGASYKGIKVGNLGDAGCFSFHAVKNLSCGDGGMITTNDFRVYERAKKLRWCGIDKSTYDREGWEYEISEMGYKCHMNDITASIGLVQLSKLDDANRKRAELADRYTKGFSNGHHAIAPVVKTPIWDDDVYKSSWHLYAVQTEGRDELYEHLKKNGVTVGVHYKPIYEFEAYKKWGYPCPEADKRWKWLLSLPMYPDMTENEQDKIINLIRG